MKSQTAKCLEFHVANDSNHSEITNEDIRTKTICIPLPTHVITAIKEEKSTQLIPIETSQAQNTVGI